MKQSVFKYNFGLADRNNKKSYAVYRYLILVVVSLFVIFPFKGKAANYFFTDITGTASLSTLTNWKTNSDGTGTSPANFTTNNDTFNIRPGASGLISASWTLGSGASSGAGVTVNDSGTVTFTSTFTVTLSGKNANSSSFNVYGTIVFVTTVGSMNLSVGNTACAFTLQTGATLKTSNTTGVLGTNCSIVQTAGSTVTLSTLANYEFNGASQTMTGTPATVNNLILSGSGTPTLLNTLTTVSGNFTVSGTVTVSTTANLSIAGNLSVGDGTTFTAGAFALTVTGTTTVGGGTSGVLTISSATGTKAFNGDVTLNAGSTWNNTAANVALTLPGSISNAGTFNAGTGVYTFSGTTKTISGVLSIPSVTVSGTYQNNGTLTVTTALAGTGTLTNGATGTLNLNFTGTPGITTLNASAAGNTVNYGFAGTQTLLAVAYHHLSLSGSGAKTMPAGLTTINGNFTFGGTASASAGAGLTIGGDCILGAGTTFTAGSFTHNISGNWTNNGGTFTNTGSTINFNGITQSIAGTSATTFNNLSTSGATGTSIGIATTVGGTLTVGNGTTFTAGGFALTVTGATTVGGGTSGILTISSATGTKAFNGDITLNAGATWNNTAANVALTLPGSISNAGTFNAGTGVYTFSGTTKTISGVLSIPSVTVSGTYQNNGTLTVSTALAGTGTLTNGATGTLNIGGTIGITSLVASTTGNTVNFNGTGAQNIPAYTYYNLIISNGSAKTILTGTAVSCFTFTINDTATISLAGTGTLTVTK